MSPRICKIARRPGGDRAGIGRDDRVVLQELVQLICHHLRLHRLVGPRAALLHQARSTPSCGSAPSRGSCGLRAPQASAGARRARRRRRRPADIRPDSADRCASDRGRSARHAPDPARDRTRYRGTSCRRSAARRTPPAPPATAACREVRCRRWRKGCRRRARLFREAPSRPARRAARRSQQAVSPPRARPGRRGSPVFFAPFRISAASRSRSSEGSECCRPISLRDVMRHVARRPHVLRHRLVLHVDRDGDMRHAAIGERGPAGERHDILDMRRAHDPRVVDGDVHEKLVELHVLLRVGVEQIVELQAGDGEHRRPSSLAS